ncbi:histone-lysine N-methyltransferase SETD1B-like isoform X2 [Cherax quadricarinatus]
MQGQEHESTDPKVAKTGILKGGKLWKNGDGKKPKAKVEEEEVDEPRRSVRFSGRDEYSLLENLPLDKIPLDAANSAALARFMPKLRELGMLLGEGHEDWHVELSPIKTEPDGSPSVTNADMSNEDQQKQLPPQLDDEHIKESMQRYDEMRRRIAAAEGRDNTSVCSDESKSSSDSQSSDSTMTETRIRRLENADVAHVAGGVMRSNSEVRRAIERNALRRSLIRFSDARKKDTNKNDKSEKGETSLLEKLKWLTASEDATNGNSEQKDDEDQEGEEDEDDKDSSKNLDPKVQETIAQYRKLAEMFNKTTSLRATDILVPRDVREWKLQSDLFPDIKGPLLDSDGDDLTETHSGSTTPTLFQAIPAVSISDLISDEENDKLIYSGGVRYTREGTLPPASEDAEDEEDGQQAPASASTASEARKQFLSQMSSHQPIINGVSAHPGDRSSLASNSDSYTFDDIDEALHDDRSSSVPSSSQSSPRLSGKSDMDGTSTTESGYSSNETNGELCPINGLSVSGAQILGLPAGGVDIDELAEFVRQDAGRMERLRRRYDAGELEDHGFIRRPSVRGIKPRFGSTTDLLKQMATQLAPPAMAQSGMAGSHMTWPYRDVGDDESGPPQRRRASTNRAVLPALQEDMLYIPTSDLSPQGGPSPSTSSATVTSLTHTKAPRVVHVYASTGDLRAPPPPRLVVPRESPPPDLIRPGNVSVPVRAHSLSMSQVPLDGPVQGMVMAPQMPTPIVHEHHYSTCRRPSSVHGHLPPDSLVTRSVPPPQAGRPHSTLSHYPNPRVPVHYHPYEEPPPSHASYEGGHQPLAQRGSYPGTIPAPIPSSHYQPPMIPHDPTRYPNPPPYGSQHPHSRPPIASPREGAPYTRTVHPQMHSVPQVSSMPLGSVQVHQCGPRHPPHVRLVGGSSVTDQACSPVWSHQHLQPPHPHIHQNYPSHPVSSHPSYTTPIVPDSITSTRPSGQPVGPPIGPPIINGSVGKLDGLRDERGVPEGASSSPRGPVDAQYPASHGSPTRDATLMHRLPPPVNMT